MKKRIYAILILSGFVAALTFCNKPTPLSENPIGAIGHGAILDKEGKMMKLTEPFIKQIQELYIRKLSDAKLAVREGGSFDEQKIKATRDVIYNTVDNDVLANGLYIEWLIGHRKPADEAQFSTVNNALRWYYVLNIQKNSILPDKQHKWSKGIPDDEAGKLEDKGIIVYAITNSGMQAYCEECLEAGVPVPANMFGAEWDTLGAFDNEFICDGEQAELMIYVSESPEGFCLALPRYTVSGTSVGNEAQVFGVICLGTRTSKACFFDNPNGTFYRRSEVIDFRSNWVGGTDLILNSQGTCTNCHAGENPYTIHPDKPPFAAIYAHVRSTLPARWYDPLVPATWPQNPGPTYMLDAVPSTGQCNGCHQQGLAGRFPDIPALYSPSLMVNEYCLNVLNQAVRPITSGGTMPRPPMSRSLFEPHINALQSYCSITRYPGEVTSAVIPGNLSFISPPMVIGPLYACATQVAVRGAVLDAKVMLYVNSGTGVSTTIIDPARNPLQLNFTGLPELRAGDIVTATQEIDGAVSDTSEPVIVRNYRDDYPDSLPKPVIDPTTVYGCAELIAVRHVPGAILTVYTNGANPISYATSTGWSAVSPAGAPFNVADQFTVQISLCGDVSRMSDSVNALTPPGILPTPTFNPPNIYNGQELLNIETIEYGAKVTLSIPGAIWSGSFSTPVTWFPGYDIKTAMGRPLRGSDILLAMQRLCLTASPWTPEVKLHDCDRLPAPRIETPIAGSRFVIVSESVPGARVMIYDASNNEIGDGSGTVVVLSRAIIAGESLTVVQRVGECTGNFVYRVRASGGN